MRKNEAQALLETRDFFDREAGDFAAGARGKEGDELKLDMLRELARDGDSLLDIGGGNGYFSDRVLAETNISRACVLEISKAMLSLNKKTPGKHLCLASALRMPFKPGTFNFVHFDAVLHHIVGITRRSSARQALEAIRNSTDLVTRDGYMVLTERCVDKRISSIIIFNALKFLSRTGLSRLFGIAGGLVVSFLTPEEFLSGIRATGADIIKTEVVPEKPGFLFRLALCGNHPRVHVLIAPPSDGEAVK